MTRHSDTPDDWQTGRSKNPARGRHNKKSFGKARSQFPPVSDSTSGGIRPQRLNDRMMESEDELEEVAETPAIVKLWLRLRLPTSWQFWAILTVIVSGSLGFVAVALLFKLPAVPNCPAIYWPTASASLRLYCAQLAANKNTVDDLLEAIALVNGLPQDHPLRSQINRNIEDWALEILKLAEQSYQAGKLEEAIAAARKIPAGTPAAELVEKRIEGWQSTWSQAQELYDKAVQLLRNSKWHNAFEVAVQLTKLGNEYWATTKYEQFISLMHQAQEDSAKLDKAHKLLRRGGVENLLEAIKVAQQLGANSFAYKEALDIIKKSADKLLNLAQERLDRGDWQTVLEIANKIPDSVNLKQEAEDLGALAKAQSVAVQGGIPDLEQAISLVQQLPQGRPLYNKAQQLIGRWQLEIQDVAYLNRARNFATSGNASDLRAAISEAQRIPSSNPRGDEARSLIGSWRRQVETMEDKPLLDRADQLASFGGVPSLQDAIDQASQVGRGRVLYPQAQSKIRRWSEEVQRLQDRPILERAEQLAFSGSASSLQDAIRTASQIRRGRVLYSEAQSKIGQWTNRVQRQQDQPLLDQAQSLAYAGNLNGAIAAAEQIKSGRVLYGEARSKIGSWQREIDGQQNLQSAYQLATPGTPDAIAAAIRTARRVPRSSQARPEARDAINRWSSQLLVMAREMSPSDLQRAIAIAQNIPSGTDAYPLAQQQIQAWRKALQPAPPVLEPL